MGNQESRRGRDEDSEEEERRDDRDREREEKSQRNTGTLSLGCGTKFTGDFSEVKLSGRFLVENGERSYEGDVQDGLAHG